MHLYLHSRAVPIWPYTGLGIADLNHLSTILVGKKNISVLKNFCFSLNFSEDEKLSTHLLTICIFSSI